MVSFDDFKKRALNTSLKPYEKVGFKDIHRKDTEHRIFPDILSKVISLNLREKTVLDIGCGCSLPVIELIRHCEANNHKLILLDSEEMLNNLPDSVVIIEKACHEFPKDENFIKQWKRNIDVIICYSVLHILYPYQNVFTFVDKAVSLLCNGGQMLLGDIANITKKKRYLSSETGIAFHKQWSGNDNVPEVRWIDDYEEIDDSVIIQLLLRYRSMGLETYLLPQKDGLPMNHTREDILICRR